MTRRRPTPVTVHRVWWGVALLLVAGVATAWTLHSAGDRGGRAVADARLVYFRTQPFGLGQGASAVLRDPAEARAFPGRLRGGGPNDLGDRLVEHSAPGRVLVALAYAVACTQARSAQLVDTGTGAMPDFGLRLLSTTEHSECVAPNDVIAVFSVPGDQVPEGVRLRGRTA